MKRLQILVLLSAPLAAFAQTPMEPLIHNWSDPSADGNNTFIGINTGNMTMSPHGGPILWASDKTEVCIK